MYIRYVHVECGKIGWGVGEVKGGKIGRRDGRYDRSSFDVRVISAAKERTFAGRDG